MKFEFCTNGIHGIHRVRCYFLVRVAHLNLLVYHANKVDYEFNVYIHASK